MDSIPIALFWVFALLGLLGKRHVLLYLFFGSMPFGSFAVVPPELTAGLTLTPTPIVALLIIMRSLCCRQGLRFIVAAIRSPKRLLLLFLFWLVALVTTFFMPRIFNQEVMIIPVRPGISIFGEALTPTTQNFSQVTYLTISVFAVFAFSRILRDPVQRQHALSAMCLGATLVIFTGLLDLLTQYVAIDSILQPFRTATYALMTEVLILGGKRVVGLMPEASSYGTLCLSFLCSLYFFRHAMAKRWLRRRLAPALIILLLIFTWLSTSSSAYIGLFVFSLVAAIDWLWVHGTRSLGILKEKGLGFETWTALAALVVVALIMIFKPSVLDSSIDIINEMVFKKTQSGSYEERSMWTAVGWQALIDTWGLGVGIGGTRTSNFAAAVFSNTGIIGGLLFFSFVLQSLRRKTPSAGDRCSRAMLRGIRYTYAPIFLVSLLVGTTADFGTFNAFLYGLALAVVLKAQARASSKQARPAPVLRQKPNWTQLTWKALTQAERGFSGRLSPSTSPTILSTTFPPSISRPALATPIP